MGFITLRYGPLAAVLPGVDAARASELRLGEPSVGEGSAIRGEPRRWGLLESRVPLSSLVATCGGRDNK